MLLRQEMRHNVNRIVTLLYQRVQCSTVTRSSCIAFCDRLTDYFDQFALSTLQLHSRYSLVIKNGMNCSTDLLQIETSLKWTHLIISKSLWSDTLMFLAMFQERCTIGTADLTVWSLFHSYRSTASLYWCAVGNICLMSTFPSSKRRLSNIHCIIL